MTDFFRVEGVQHRSVRMWGSNGGVSDKRAKKTFIDGGKKSIRTLIFWTF